MSSVQVTVLMSVYNGARHLADSIESVIGDDYEDFELLIVDDGSTDETPGILATYVSTDQRVRVLRKHNSGLTDSLNYGLSEARGRYIARLDADDLNLVGRLREQVAFLDDHPDVALVGTDARLISASGIDLGRTKLGELDHEMCVARLLAMDAFFAHSSWMVRRETVVKIGGYDVFFKKAQDYEFLLRLAETERLACIGRPLIALRKQETSVSFDVDFTQHKFALTALLLLHQRQGMMSNLPVDERQTFSLVEQWLRYSGYQKLLLGQRYLSFAWYRFQERDIYGAFANFAKALRVDWKAPWHRGRCAWIRRNAPQLTAKLFYQSKSES